MKSIPDQAVLDAVRDYAADIIVEAKEYDINADIDVTFYEANDSTETRSAHEAIITSEIGMVIVFPDFKKNSAQATIVNVGEMKRLVAEGFDEEFIENEGLAIT
jgi:adenosyl cobinamide kinase/adenosyl cobinamide phosphate guanylyltransferase